MTQRIQKLIAQRGVASRRTVEQWISQGRVTCNGQICNLGDRADLDVDTILIDGKPLPQAQEPVYLMLHKPRGYVTTLSDEKGRKNAASLVLDCGTRVYPVGRLDMDSEGLLLFTNDGEFANQLMHPRHMVEKTYRVTVGEFSREKLEKLRLPVCLDGYTIAPPLVELSQCHGQQASLLITIHEGRNRQVRRMCAMAGMCVKRLVRIREGSLHLGQLPLGAWRYLTKEEIESLRK